MFSSAITWVSILAAINGAIGHSWVEQISIIDLSGDFVETAGFPRGNGWSCMLNDEPSSTDRIVLRTSPDFDDSTMTYLLPPDGRYARALLPSDRICKSSQQTDNQTEGSPALRAFSGANIALRYQENGHITLTQNNPPGKLSPGKISVFGTTASRPNDSILEIYGVWDFAGQAGDKRGRLLTIGNFDDGQCYQINDSPLSKERQQKFAHSPNPLEGQNLWCKITVTLPLNLVPGTLYTLYWVWDWPTAAGTPGLPFGQLQIYTTCIDIVIV